MLVTLDWIHYHYYKFNKEYFGDLLPSIDFKISRSKNSWGFAEFTYDYPNDTIIPTRIIMSNYYDSPEEVKLHTLLHEMIHIADYTFNPHHFIKNHKKVSGHRYDAHGWWFQKECERLKKYGWNIDRFVSMEDQNLSKPSKRAIDNLNNKKSICIACVITSDNKAFVFKTDIYKLNEVKKTIKKISNREWTRFLDGEINSVKFYKTSSEQFSSLRSRCKKLTGKKMPLSYLDDYMSYYKFNEFNS